MELNNTPIPIDIDINQGYDVLINNKNPNSHCCKMQRNYTNSLLKEEISIGNDKQCFIDDYVIDYWCNIIRKPGTGKKNSDAILKRDKEWETNRCFFSYPSVVTDGNKLYCYYNWCPGIQSLAISEDGENWIKPILGRGFDKHIKRPFIYTYQSETSTTPVYVPKNSNYIGSHGLSSFSVLYDKNEPDEKYRYKVAMQGIEKEGVIFKYSSNGIDWIDYPASISEGYRADTCNNLSKSDLGYMCFPRNANLNGLARTTCILINKDINTNPTNWIKVNEIVLDILPNELYLQQIYGLTHSFYNGIHLVVYLIYNCSSQKITLSFGSSRDGINYDLRMIYANKPLIEETKEIDYIMIPSSIITFKNKQYIFYSASKYKHEKSVSIEWDFLSGIYAYEFPIDTISYITNTQTYGIVITKIFECRGSLLEIGAKFYFNSKLTIIILNQDMSDNTHNFITTLNQLPDKYVTWGNGTTMTQLIGQKIRFKFIIENVDMYSFHIHK